MSCAYRTTAAAQVGSLRGRRPQQDRRVRQNVRRHGNDTDVENRVPPTTPLSGDTPAERSPLTEPPTCLTVPMCLLERLCDTAAFRVP